MPDANFLIGCNRVEKVIKLNCVGKVTFPGLLVFKGVIPGIPLAVSIRDLEISVKRMARKVEKVETDAILLDFDGIARLVFKIPYDRSK